MKRQCGRSNASRQAGHRLSIACPAKLNVFLEVLGKRPDGYHNLETVMLRTKFCDQLTVVDRADGSLSLRFSDATSEPFRAGTPLDNRNLILRAAEAVRKRIGRAAGAEFILHKRIPPESGMGGGSSDAASTLLACRQIWQADMSDEELHEIAASLGSDINFLLSGYRAAICRGRGEIVESLPLKRHLHFVACRPSSGNSTAEVFREAQVSEDKVSADAIVRILTGDLAEPLEKHIHNRLTDAARKLNPEMNSLMARLRHCTQRTVFLSGSGSMVFLTAESARSALALQQQIRSSLRICGWILEV